MDLKIIWYKTQGRGVKHTFPRKIILNENFFIGLGLSMGDGLNNPSIKNTHYNFANSNFHLVKLISEWLEEIFGISSDKLQFFIHTRTSNKNVRRSITEVGKLFNIKQADLRTYFSNRHNKDVLTIQTSNVIFQLIYSKLFDYLKQEIITNNNFRRAFLKGLFAAEGHVKHSVYNTIESISFSFNPHNEYFLAEFVQKCLNIEGIKANIGYDTVYLCGYENMLKFYILGITGLNENKMGKFTDLCKNASIVLHFKNGLLDKLKDKISQRKLSKYLGCSQSSISKSYKNRYFPMMNLCKILGYLEIEKEDLVYYTDYITVRTSIIRDKKSIKFLISNKLSTLR